MRINRQPPDPMSRREGWPVRARAIDDGLVCSGRNDDVRRVADECLVRKGGGFHAWSCPQAIENAGVDVEDALGLVPIQLWIESEREDTAGVEAEIDPL